MENLSNPTIVAGRARLALFVRNAEVTRRRADDLLARPRSRYWGQCLRRGTILKKQERLQRRQAEAASRVAQAEARLLRFDALFTDGTVTHV